MDSKTILSTPSFSPLLPGVTDTPNVLRTYLDVQSHGIVWMFHRWGDRSVSFRCSRSSVSSLRESIMDIGLVKKRGLSLRPILFFCKLLEQRRRKPKKPYYWKGEIQCCYSPALSVSVPPPSSVHVSFAFFFSPPLCRAPLAIQHTGAWRN